MRPTRLSIEPWIHIIRPGLDGRVLTYSRNSIRRNTLRYCALRELEGEWHVIPLMSQSRLEYDRNENPSSKLYGILRT